MLYFCSLPDFPLINEYMCVYIYLYIHKYKIPLNKNEKNNVDKI